jgi:hypothetical protein
MEAQGAVLSNVIFGVKAPDSSKIKSAEKVFACPSRKILEKLRDKVPGGRRTVWWPWMQALPHPYLGPEFAARIILDSPTATVEDSPEIQDLGRLFVEMATEVDKLLGE